MFDGRWRQAVDRTTGPVGQSLQRRGVTADVLTGTGLLSALATAIAVGTGHLVLAIFLLILTGLHDLLDGPVAKAAGTTSVRGAFFDSVTDRVSDTLLMGGVAWYLIARHHDQTALLPLAVLGVTNLVSYERAKAEALGVQGAKGGLMERAERLILLGVGFIEPWLLVPVLWALLVLTSATAIGRFARVWKLAEGPAPRPASAHGDRLVRSARADRADRLARASRAEGEGPRWRPGKVESRWRAWREAREEEAGTTSRTIVGRAGEPGGRWRARRQESPASRTSRTRRARGEGRQPSTVWSASRRGSSSGRGTSSTNRGN